MSAFRDRKVTPEAAPHDPPANHLSGVLVTLTSTYTSFRGEAKPRTRNPEVLREIPGSREENDGVDHARLRRRIRQGWRFGRGGRRARCAGVSSKPRADLGGAREIPRLQIGR